MKIFGGVKFWVRRFGGSKKSVRSKGVGVESDYKTNLSRVQGSLCRDLGTSIKPKNNQLCDFMTIETGRLAGIPGL